MNYRARRGDDKKERRYMGERAACKGAHMHDGMQDLEAFVVDVLDRLSEEHGIEYLPRRGLCRDRRTLDLHSMKGRKGVR